MVESGSTAARDASVVLVTEQRTKHHAEPAGTALEATADLRRVDWLPEMDETQRSALLDDALPGAAAVVESPWTWATLPQFTPERWAKATGLKVIAGTFDNRFGNWLDVRDALQRGVTVKTRTCWRARLWPTSSSTP